MGKTPVARSSHFHPLGVTYLWVPSFSVDMDLDFHTSSMLKNKQYLYTEDLLSLDSCRPIQDEFITPHCANSPLNLSQCKIFLEDHPDTYFKDFILTGIQSDFWIGFNCHVTLKFSDHNMPSKVPSMILEFLKRNVSLGRYIGSVSPVDYEAKSFLQQSAGCWTIKTFRVSQHDLGAQPPDPCYYYYKLFYWKIAFNKSFEQTSYLNHFRILNLRGFTVQKIASCGGMLLSWISMKAMSVIGPHIHNLPQAPRFLLVALVVAISEEWQSARMLTSLLGTV